MEKVRPIVPILTQSEQWMKRTVADRLSGGQRHQVALAMTLLTTPKVVILDEPSAGLSPKAVVSMYKLLQEAKEAFSLTILLIEQNVAKAVEFCDRCVLIQQGSIGQVFGAGEIGKVEDVMFNSVKR